MSKTVEELEQDYLDAADAADGSTYESAYVAVDVAHKLWQDKLKEGTK